MDTLKRLFFIIFLLGLANFNLLAFTGISSNSDTSQCLIDLELDQLENGDIMVSMIPDTTWNFPFNIVSTAQFTIKAPTGNFGIDTIINLIDQVVFFETSTVVQPTEAPGFDYISIGLGAQGTDKIPFEKGMKVNLFVMKNSLSCNIGSITLMNNFSDPFFPPNAQDANVGQQITVAGYNLADTPIGIRGTGIACEPKMEVENPTDSVDLGVQIVQQDISCFGLTDGLIVAKGNGGTPPYIYNWNTLDTSSTIENLEAGDYQLTLTDATGAMISVEVTITEPMQLFLGIDKMDATDAISADGSATPIFAGGTGPFQFEWSNGSMDSLQTNLEVGTYMLTVTDANGCEISQSIIISHADCPAIDVMLDMKAPNCPGDSTGGLRVTPLTGLAPYSFIWETGDTTLNLDNIPTGNYMVTITDANGCMMAVSALLPDANPIIIELTADEDTEPGEGSISSVVSGGSMPYTYAWSNGSNDQSISGLENGVYELMITDANDCIQSASIVIGALDDCTLGLLTELGQDVILDTINCQESGEICLPVPLDSMVNYSLFLDGTSYMESITGCQFDTLYAFTYFTLPGRGDFGPYLLRDWSLNGQTFTGEFQNITALVDSMNTWDELGTWTIDTDILIIEGGLAANSYGEMTIETPLTSSTTTLDLNTRLTPTGTLVSFESGAHELILIDKRTTCSDTLNIMLPCDERVGRDTTIVVEVQIGELDSISLSNIFGDDFTISVNQCPNEMDGNATIDLSSNNDQVNIEGIEAGTDEACYIITIKDITGSEGENDTIINLTIQVIVLPQPMDCPSFIDLDTFSMEVAGCEDFSICVPLNYDSLLTYAITDNGAAFSGIVSACDNDNGSMLTFTAAATHQLIFTNSENCQDTLIVAINAPACDEDLVIRDTIEVNEMGESCITFEGLPTPFQSVRDICPEKNGEMVMFDIEGTDGCIDYIGVELGTDTACIEVCDVFGFCDTITLVIIVSSGETPFPDFAAVDDSTSTGLNEPIVLNALGNDIFSTIESMELVTFPENGIATFNLDGTIRYVPVTDYCNDSIPETFDYAICNETVCDTATVTIFVNCVSSRDFIIYTGLSPNGDGVNDVFQIDGIEDYPNNSVKIFNRWGNTVYEMDGYKNEWNGNWGRRGELLPDGTYFYIFDTGEGKQHSGFLEIRR